MGETPLPTRETRVLPGAERFGAETRHSPTSNHAGSNACSFLLIPNHTGSVLKSAGRLSGAQTRTAYQNIHV